MRTQHEVQHPPQFVDVFVASVAAQPERMWQTLRWLGRMASSLCLLEAFSGPVREEDARSCLRKQLTLHHALALAASERAAPTAPLPTLWLLSSGRARGLSRSWAMAAVPGWPAGFYRAAPGLGVWLVVLPDLPRTRETLPLRLFGDERVRQGLASELTRLPADDPLRRQVSQMLLRWGLWLRGQPRDEAARRFLVDFEQVVQEELRRLRAEGKAEGVAETLRTSIADLCEVLGIALTPERQAQLGALDNAGLEALRQALKQRRAWPDT